MSTLQIPPASQRRIGAVNRAEISHQTSILQMPLLLGLRATYIFSKTGKRKT